MHWQSFSYFGLTYLIKTHFHEYVIITPRGINLGNVHFNADHHTITPSVGNTWNKTHFPKQVKKQPIFIVAEYTKGRQINRTKRGFGMYVHE